MLYKLEKTMIIFLQIFDEHTIIHLVCIYKIVIKLQINIIYVLYSKGAFF